MLTIIGCGNSNRSDDGVGVVVAQRLAAEIGPELSDLVSVFDAGTDGMGVMYRAKGSQELIIVDASRSGSEPGTVFEVPGEELSQPPRSSLNLHDFRWDHALFVGRKIYRDDFPTAVTVYLIEAESVALGLDLSPCVELAAERVLATLRERIARLD